MSSGWCFGKCSRTGKSGDFPAECVYVLPTITKPPTEILVSWGLDCFSLFLFFPLSGLRCCLQLFSPPHLLFFSTLLCLLSSSSSLPPLLSSSHLSLHSPPISALASLVSSCPAHVTLPLSSVVCHPPSFLRVLLTVACSSPVSLSSSSALPSLPLTPPFFACLLSLLLLN